jgi:hypothetical protein
MKAHTTLGGTMSVKKIFHPRDLIEEIMSDEFPQYVIYEGEEGKVFVYRESDIAGRADVVWKEVFGKYALAIWEWNRWERRQELGIMYRYNTRKCKLVLVDLKNKVATEIFSRDGGWEVIAVDSVEEVKELDAVMVKWRLLGGQWGEETRVSYKGLYALTGRKFTTIALIERR